MIHPSAFVDPAAQLAADVEVGPGAIIESGAVIGEGCRIQAHAVITGHVRMGVRNTIGYGAILGADPQDYDFKPGTKSEVLIGDDNIIREYVTIHRGTKEGSVTQVGDKNFLMVGVHLGHNASIGNRVIIANNCLLAGYVEVQDGAVLGGGSVFHQFLRVGRLCMVRGGERFPKDIPPFVSAYGTSMVAGINAVGLKRAGFSSENRLEIKRAFRLIYHNGLNITQALEESKNTSWGTEAQEFLDFIASAKKRGVCAAKPVNGGSSSSSDSKYEEE
ncbi:MAG: acyl-ACP--UDP-N-acetylglucosamine O-acyltransferase [Verrucomicrobia bacterium]|nr:acyl-ACP--UDP-N-acetylglucosamine O-acyltransferase [Verrucomicrobiota bacterium]